jgi:hypothetical protein
LDTRIEHLKDPIRDGFVQRSCCLNQSSGADEGAYSFDLSFLLFLFLPRFILDPRRIEQLGYIGVGAMGHQSLIRQVDRFADLSAVDLDLDFTDPFFDVLASLDLPLLAIGSFFQ